MMSVCAVQTQKSAMDLTDCVVPLLGTRSVFYCVRDRDIIKTMLPKTTA